MGCVQTCCCAGGASLPVLPFIELCGAVWVFEHLVAVLVVCAVCGVLGLTGSVALVTWMDRRSTQRTLAWREERWAPRQVQRATIRAIAEPVAGPQALPVQPAAIAEPARAALEPVPLAITSDQRAWLCTKCFWAWPLDQLFCGICGQSRATASAGREVRSHAVVRRDGNAAASPDVQR